MLSIGRAVRYKAWLAAQHPLPPPFYAPGPGDALRAIGRCEYTSASGLYAFTLGYLRCAFDFVVLNGAGPKTNQYPRAHRCTDCRLPLVRLTPAPDAGGSQDGHLALLVPELWGCRKRRTPITVPAPAEVRWGFFPADTAGGGHEAEVHLPHPLVGGLAWTGRLVGPDGDDAASEAPPPEGLFNVHHGGLRVPGEEAYRRAAAELEQTEGVAGEAFLSGYLAAVRYIHRFNEGRQGVENDGDKEDVEDNPAPSSGVIPLAAMTPQVGRIMPPPKGVTAPPKFYNP